MKDSIWNRFDVAQAKMVTITNIAVFGSKDDCIVYMVHYDLEAGFGDF